MRIKQKRNFTFRYTIAFLIVITINSFSISVNAQVTKIEKDSTQFKVAQDIKKGHDLYDLIQSDPRNKKYREMSKQGWMSGLGDNSYLRFGGYVQINFIQDLQNTGYPYGEFIPAGIPVPTDKTSNIAFDPRTTRLTFETQNDTKKGTVSSFISFDLSGMAQSGSIQPRLRQAYVSWINASKRQSVLIGQAGSTITDGNVWLESFDLEGQNSMMYLRQVMIRYTFMLSKGDSWVGSIAIEQPNSDVQNGQGLESIPDLIFTASLKKKWGHLRLGGLGRLLEAESPDGTGKAEAFGWGLTFSGQIKVNYKQDNFLFQITGGQGFGRYMQDLGSASNAQGAVYDSILKSLTPLDSYGGFVGYQHWWMDNLRTTASVGYVSVQNQEIQNDDDLNSTTYSVVNLIYSPFKRLDIGLEYYYGERVNKNETSGSANRILLGTKYSF